MYGDIVVIFDHEVCVCSHVSLSVQRMTLCEQSSASVSFKAYVVMFCVCPQYIFLIQHIFFSFKICNTFPILFDYFPGSHNTVIKNFTEITNYILEKIKEHQQTLDADNPRDFIDCFIIKMKQVKCYLFACAVGSLMICDYWGQIRNALRSPRLWLSVANFLILFKKYRYPMLSRHHKTLKIAGGL